MSKGKNQWVVKDGGNWAVRGEGNEKLTSKHDTQASAIKAAKAIAKNQQSEMVIQSKSGKIRAKHSYGNDPFPPKG
ncbi:DUF2188 domain-containing protein [Vibrio mexicanus]|uniref:DUF2188 domain-containing protein n=1 Tax=Vibrio mexicanus TaxID=1004326 RepID=UPI00063C7B5B|nr:DUF2188 domain-containing protein [Vibrio mexicanus]